MNLSHAVKCFSRKHFSLFSEKKVCVCRWSQGRQLHSSPYWGTGEEHCALLTDTGASLSEAWHFWGVHELVIYSLLTSQDRLPRGKPNFPHFRTHRDARLLLLLGTDTRLPLGQGLKVSWSLVNIYFVVCHLCWYSKLSPSFLSPRHKYIACLHHSLCFNKVLLLLPHPVWTAGSQLCLVWS